jgi:hypothetical protein
MHACVVCVCVYVIALAITQRQMAQANRYNRCKWCHGRPAVAVWSRCGGPVLLYMCPHTSCCWQARCDTTIYVSSYYYICVLILVAAGRHAVILLYMCPRTTIYVSSY